MDEVVEEPQKVIKKIKRETGDGQYYVVYEKGLNDKRPKSEYVSQDSVPNDIVNKFLQKRKTWIDMGKPKKKNGKY